MDVCEAFALRILLAPPSCIVERHASVMACISKWCYWTQCQLSHVVLMRLVWVWHGTFQLKVVMFERTHRCPQFL